MTKISQSLNNTQAMVRCLLALVLTTVATFFVEGGWYKTYNSYNQCGYGTVLSYLWRNQQNCAGNTGNSMNVGSPCPNIFQYDWDGLEWHGIITAPSLPFGTPARLVAHLSIGRALPTKYAGSIELIGPRADVLNAMLTAQPIRYKVNFPLPHPLPLMTTIYLNDRLICSGPTVQAPIITSITLEHTLYPNSGKPLDAGRHPLPQGGQFPSLQQPSEEQPVDQIIPQQTLGRFNNGLDTPNIINNNKNIRNPNEDNSIPIINSGNGSPFAIDDTTRDNGFAGKNNRFNLTNNVPGSGSSVERNLYSDICGKAVTARGLVANGHVTKMGSHPWLVAVFAQKVLGLEFTCGGTLINNKYVITAAHCIRYGENPALEPDEIVVVLGKYRIRRWTEHGSLVRDAARVIVHPEYKALSGDADLAAIELFESVPYTDKIRPVCMWVSSPSFRGPVYEDLVGKEGTIVGWGRDEQGTKITPEPRSTNVRVVSQEDCLRSRIDFRYITSNRTICAGGVDPGSGPCSGDSGGGLFVWNDRQQRWFLRGVISMSLVDSETKSCDFKYYSVFVDLSKFTEWISQFTVW